MTENPTNNPGWTVSDEKLRKKRLEAHRAIVARYAAGTRLHLTFGEVRESNGSPQLVVPYCYQPKPESAEQPVAWRDEIYAMDL